MQTSAQVSPQAQIIANPDRLVIDVPNARPGPVLRNQLVNRRDVERIRVGLFANSPPTTRIVLDLKSVQPYRITPTGLGFTVSVGPEAAPAAPPPPNTANNADVAPNGEKTIGWVTAAVPTVNAASRASSVVVRQFAQDTIKANNGVRVQFSQGQLEIHARDARLADVLFQIEQQTGADISIPPGVEQERISGDFGPGSSSEVVSQLFNGSDLNFVMVGSPSNPNALRSVTLTRKNGGGADYVPSEPSQPVASNNQPENVEIQQQIEPRPEDVPQAEPDATQQPTEGVQQPQPEDSSAYSPQN
ncbi:MAG TPA: AMIN domain-containing protein [Terriglobales bacterium]|nr:AMIN domain-containing protein [Terriglobales bacterium]